jgi:hypothetical protein
MTQTKRITRPVCDPPDKPLTGRWRFPDPRPGELDFWRIHALALDRLGDVIGWFLPEGVETDDGYWQGLHPDRPILIRVSLLTGKWTEPISGRSGADLVSLVAHLFAISQPKAAAALARKLGANVVAHA